MTVDEAYAQWLNGLMVPTSGGETRREFAEKINSNFADLSWAFRAGWELRYSTLTTKDI